MASLKDTVRSWLGIEKKDFAWQGFTPVDAGVNSGLAPLSSFNYGNRLRGGLDSNVVMAPMNWIMTNFTEAEPVVEAKREAMWKTVDEHPLADLLQQPNPYYDGDTLFKASILSHLLDGNAYWQKIRNRFGSVLGYYYLPHFLVEPKRPQDGSEFLSHYEYRPVPSGRKIDIAPRDMVHLRFGIDPENTLKGLSKLKPLLREVFTDEEASNFAASILRNMGVPGGVIAPSSSDALPAPKDVEEMKKFMQTDFTGDKRGRWLVLGQPTSVAQFGFNPQSLMITDLRDVAEERVCAALGVPAAIVGFGSGLQSTKVGATMRELRRMAWVDCIMPLQKSIGKQLSRQLLPDFVSQMRRFRVRFDTSTVAAFGEEKMEEAARVGLLVEKNILRIDRAQDMLGLEVDTSRAVYADELKPEPEPDPEPEPNMVNRIAAQLGNGNGNGAEEE